MPKQILAVDFSELFFSSIFGWRRACQMGTTLPLEFMVLKKLFSYCKAFPGREIYIMCDGTKTWRKEVYPNYKAQRKEQRDKYEDLDWTDLFAKYGRMISTIENFTPMLTFRDDILEADDLEAILAKDGEDLIIFCLEGKTKITLINKHAKFIRDIKAGDKLLSFDLDKKEYTQATVLKTHQITRNRTMKLYFGKTKNSAIQCGEEHPLYTTRGWIKARDLKVGDEIQYNQSHFNRWNRSNLLDFKGLIPRRENLYRLGYLYGAFLGDGHINKTTKKVHIEVKDKEFLIRIQEYLKYLYHYNATINVSIAKNSRFVNLTLGSSFIFDKLFADINNYNSSRPFKKGFLAGLFDADGTLVNYKGSMALRISNKCEALLVQVQQIFKELDISSNKIIKLEDAGIRKVFGKEYNCNALYRLGISKNEQVLKFFNDCKPALLRKYPVFNHHANFLCNGKKITKIEIKTTKSCPYKFYDLTLTAPHTYFANGCLSHNSSDKDLNQLTIYPNLKLVSPKGKKVKGKFVFKVVEDPIKELDKLVMKGDVADNVPRASSEAQKIINNKIVNLINLPQDIEERCRAVLNQSRTKSPDLVGFCNLYQWSFVAIELKKIYPTYSL